MWSFRRLNFIALFAGFIGSLIIGAGLAELLLSFYSRPAPSWFDFVWKLTWGFPFLAGGYVAAWIAKDAPLLNSMALANLWLAITIIYGIFSPFASDPISEVLIAAGSKFVWCCLGGFVRFWLGSDQTLEQAV